LSRDYRKAGAQRVARAVQRYAALLHGLKERRLGLWRGTIDFIREQHIAKHWTLRERERARLKIEQVRTQDVAGHQIWRELDAAEFQVERVREALCEQRLRGAWRTFQEDMAAGEYGGQHQRDAIGLTNDGFTNLCADGVRELAKFSQL